MKVFRRIVIFLLIIVCILSVSLYSREGLDFEITRLYINSGKLCAIELEYDRKKLKKDATLVLELLYKKEVEKTQYFTLEKGKIKGGTNEISGNGLIIPEDRAIKVYVLDSVENGKVFSVESQPEIVMEAEHIEGDILQWRVSSDGKTLYEYKGNERVVVIPNYLNSKHITSVGRGVRSKKDYKEYNIFGGNSIDRVEISEGIVNINHCAFMGGLESQGELKLPKSLKSIGTVAFAECRGFNGDLILPDGLQRIGSGAFAFCDFDGLVKISGNVKKIPSLAFKACEKISALEIGEGVEEICEQAFHSCVSLKGDLIIPDTVQKIEKYAFWGCGFDGQLKLGSGIKILDGYSFSKSGNFSEVVFSEGLEEIGECAFDHCKFKGGIILPEGLKKVGAYAFQYCDEADGELYLPSTLEVISDGAFNHCMKLKGDTLVFPDGLKMIGGDYRIEENSGYGGHIFYAFGNYSEYVISNNAENFKTVDGVLFNKEGTRLIAYPNNKIVKEYEIPEGVTSLDEMCFNLADIKTLILPDSLIVTNVIPPNILNQDGHNLAIAIYCHAHIENIKVKETNPHYTSENGLLYSKDKSAVYYIPNNNSIDGEIIIPEGVKEIKDGAIFCDEVYRIGWNRLYIPSTVEGIGEKTLGFVNHERENEEKSKIADKIVIDENNKYYKKSQTGKIEKK